MQDIIAKESNFLISKFFGSLAAPFTVLLFAGHLLNAASVEEFGAVGDGKSDDAPAFRRAIAEAVEKGEAVEIGEGRFFLGSDLILEKSIQLTGKGHEHSVLTSEGGRSRIFIRESGTGFTGIGFEEMVEPIALDTRIGKVLKDVSFRQCRFEKILVRDKNRGAIGLSSGNSNQRAFPIENLIIEESVFKDIDAHAINIRANISKFKIINNIFVDIVNNPKSESPNGGYSIRLGDSSEYNETGKIQGSHLVAGNVISGMSKESIEGNLKAILIYGDYNIIDGNRIEKIDGTLEGMDVNALYLRGAFNRITSNYVQDIRGADDDGAICMKGGLSNGNRKNLMAWNIVEDIHGLSGVEVATSDLIFFENQIINSTTRGFYHRDGENLSLYENYFENADVVLRTREGTAVLSDNSFIESRLLIEQRRAFPSNRDSVIVYGNHFQRKSSETQLPLVRFGNRVEDKRIVFRENRIQNLVGEDIYNNRALIDLASAGSSKRVDFIQNFFDQSGNQSVLLEIGLSAGEGRFFGNFFSIRDLRGPLLRSAFKKIESNNVHIPETADERLKIPVLFVVTKSGKEERVQFQKNRIVNESGRKSIGSLIESDGGLAKIETSENWHDTVWKNGEQPSSEPAFIGSSIAQQRR